MKKILKDKKKEQEICEKGYTKISLFSESEVENLLDSLYKLRPDDDFVQKEIGADYITYYDTSVDKDEEYRLKTNQLATKALSPGVKQHFIDYRVTTGSFFIKAPGVGFLPLHQHMPFTTTLDKKAFVIWCPLVDVDESNGTLQVVEGSHKIVPGLYAYDYPNFFADYRESVWKHSIPIILKAGEALIFDDKLIHGSDVNNSSSPRIVMAGMGVPINTQMVWYHFDKNKPSYFEVLEIDDSFFIDAKLTGLTIERPKGLKRLGYVKNENWKLSEKQFLSLIEIGKEMKIDINIQNDIPELDNSPISRVKSFFGKYF